MKKFAFLLLGLMFVAPVMVAEAADAYWVGPTEGTANLGDDENWDIGTVPPNNYNVYFTNLTGNISLYNNLPVGRHFDRLINKSTSVTITVTGEETLYLDHQEGAINANDGPIVIDVPVNFVNAGNTRCSVISGGDGKGLTFNGKVTFTPPAEDSNWQFYVNKGKVIFNAGIEGPVDLHTANNVDVTCNGGISVKSVFGGVWWSNGNITLNEGSYDCPLWRIGSTSTFKFQSPGTLPANTVLEFVDYAYLNYTGDTRWSGGEFTFFGDETIDYIIATNSPNRFTDGLYENINRLEGRGVITLRSSRSFVSFAAWNGVLSMVYDPLDDYTFDFGTRTNTMSGTITVKGGTLALHDGVVFTSVKEVEIENGTLSCDCAEWGSPFVDELSLRMGDDAKLALSKGTSIVADSLYRLNRYVPHGTYTGIGYGLEGVKEVDWITGPGQLTLSGIYTCWTGAVNDEWDNAGNWTDGVPQAGAEAYFIATNGNTVVTVSDGIAGPGKLFIGGVNGATMTLSGGMSLEMAWIEIASGGRIEVPAGKKFFYNGCDEAGNRMIAESSACTEDNSPIYIHDGGELLVSGGEVVITNLTGFIRLTGTADNKGLITAKAGKFGVWAKKTDKDMVFVGNGGLVTFSGTSVYTSCELGVFAGEGDGRVVFESGATASPVLNGDMYNRGTLAVDILTPVHGTEKWNKDVLFGWNYAGTADIRYSLSNTMVRAGVGGVVVAGPKSGYGHKAENLKTTVDLYQGAQMAIEGSQYQEYRPFGLLVGYGAHGNYSSSSPPQINGILNVHAGAVITNSYGHFLIGCGYATGRVCIAGGEIKSPIDNRYLRTFGIGLWHGKGELEITGGKLLVGSAAYIGGRKDSEFPDCTSKWKNFGNTSFDYHDAYGRLVHRGGTADFSQGIIVAADGSGDIECHGSGGVFTTSGLILSNTVENVESRATLKFVFDGEGVTPIESSGPLVIGEKAKLVVDTTEYPADGGSVTILRCDGIEGEFAEVELTGEFAAKARLLYRGNSIRLAASKGTTVIVR